MRRLLLPLAGGALVLAALTACTTPAADASAPPTTVTATTTATVTAPPITETMTPPPTVTMPAPPQVTVTQTAPPPRTVIETETETVEVPDYGYAACINPQFTAMQDASGIYSTVPARPSSRTSPGITGSTTWR